MGLLGHMVVLFLVFQGISIPSSIVAVSFIFPPTVQEGSSFFEDGHFVQCEVISHCSFDLHLSNNEQH